jgi:hypothetical protein
MLFSSPMVNALLDGRKTQTRRIMSPNNSIFGSAPKEYWRHGDFASAWPDNRYIHVPAHMQECEDRSVVGVNCDRCVEMGWDSTAHRLYPVWEVGDRLWVRESWQYAPERYCRCPQGAEPQPCDDWIEGTGCASNRSSVLYKAGNETAPRWRPSIHMPRWASRLTLTITDVRVQRLQDISEVDAIAEGTGLYVPGHGFVSDEELRADPGYSNYLAPRMGYEAIWSEINGAGSWDPNPWVVALTFTVDKRNIDEVQP